MVEIFALIILILSFLGIVVIFARKLPVLVTLPKEVGTPKRNLLFKLKNKILEIPLLKNFSFEILLQKILSKIRILSLRIESKTANYLQRTRERSRKEKEKENDNYWEEIKKNTNNKNLPR